MTSTITSKGQVTIPKDVRSRLGLNPGDAVEFAVSNRGVTLRKKVDRARMQSVVGCYAEALKGVSVDELMNDLRGPVDLPQSRRRR